MERALPLVLLLALVGVVLFILSQDGSEKKDTDPISIAQGDDGPEAATFDQEGPTRVAPV